MTNNGCIDNAPADALASARALVAHDYLAVECRGMVS